MKKILVIFSFILFVLSGCNNEEVETPCNCASLRYDNLYNHFYQKDRSVGFTGKCIERYSNGQLKTVKHIVDGKNNGKYTFYYPSGQIKETGSIKDNLQHGERIVYDEKGNIIAKEQYAYGQIKAAL